MKIISLKKDNNKSRKFFGLRLNIIWFVIYIRGNFSTLQKPSVLSLHLHKLH